MEFSSTKSKQLFLAYALPACLTKKLERKELTEKDVETLRKEFLKNGDVSKDLKKLVPFGMAMLKLEAKKQGKTKIDEDVISSYFMGKHSAVVDEWKKEDPDFPVHLCKPSIVQVISDKGNQFIADGKERGEIKVHKWAVPKAKKGDKLIIHYDHAVRKL